MLTPSDQTLISKAKVTTAANDDVIQAPNTHNLSPFTQPARDLDVLVTGCRIAARVVMDEDQPSGHVGNSWPEHIPGMHQA